MRRAWADVFQEETTVNGFEAKEQPSQTLARGLLILESFDHEHSEWGVRELSRALNLNPATVHRLVTTLVNAGYLEQDAETQRYILGPRVVSLAELYMRHNPIESTARIVFRRFVDRFPYSFYLGKLFGFEVVYLAAYDGHAPIKVVVETGSTIALHSTAIGLCLLAHQDESYLSTFLAKGDLIPYTPATVTDPEALRQRLAKIREKGYAVNNGEHYEDVGAVGAAIIQPGRRVEYGVSLSYPQHLINEGRISIPDLAQLTREVADEIGARLG
jgi:DNA-binding IclR family transcriptional regulator